MKEDRCGLLTLLCGQVVASSSFPSGHLLMTSSCKLTALVQLAVMHTATEMGFNGRLTPKQASYSIQFKELHTIVLVAAVWEHNWTTLKV